MKEMMTSGDFADVTLVCDDKKKIRAHRNILAACSPVFKDILQIENSSVVYLKGVYSSEMESIIQFIYLGEATFYDERMNHFLEAVKSLDIKELNKEVDETEEFNNTVEDSVQANKMEDSEKRNRFDENQTADLDHHSIDKIKHRTDKSTNVATLQNKNYCEQCDKSFTGLSGLFNHRKAVHEGVTYDCSQCDYKATLKANLKRHIKTNHEGIKKF